MPEFTQIDLAPGPDALPAALQWLEDAARRAAWPQRAVFSLKLCLDEALTNTLSHGFETGSSPTPASIRLELATHADRATLTMTDNGAAFDPTGQTPAGLARTLDEATPGGHGLRLMQHYLHELHYHFSDGRNCLRMTVLLR